MKKISNVCDGNDATGLMPPPTADSFLSRASSRNNVDEIGIESTQDILQAQVDSKIPVSPKLEVVCANNEVSVKIDNVQGNLETVYEDKDAPENGVV